MKRRAMIAAGIVTVALLAVVAVPVAAHMGTHTNDSTSGQNSGTTISLTQAKISFEQYLRRQGYDNLKISEVMQFSNQFYAEAVDAQSGAGAFEMVMNLDGQGVTPEPGPTMMWNTTYSPMFGSDGAGLRQGMPGYGPTDDDGYGMMGGNAGIHGMMSSGQGHGMMGDYDNAGNAAATPGSAFSPGSCPVSQAMGYHSETATQLDQPMNADTAHDRVQSWLDQNRPGTTATDATEFPGYFTFHTEQNGEISGMLSIQSLSGAIWEHVWHGNFVAMEPTD